ncbi:hypothetical protein C2845_PM01G18620 [Panicum miliaceum]|uniref:Uncharacterized protein n=1 Tax=Panicum miliaceum TaxID=4540 RepID=A0A3L6TIW4_PANMI|nr:hypothetical protein C2845_PM01G18620 [Panicum miliaceum]
MPPLTTGVRVRVRVRARSRSGAHIHRHRAIRLPTLASAASTGRREPASARAHKQYLQGRLHSRLCVSVRRRKHSPASACASSARLSLEEYNSYLA